MSINHLPLNEVVAKLIELGGRSKDRLNVATTGDIHLYHPRVGSRRIVAHLNAMFTSDLLKVVDMVVLNGDILDRRLSLESDEITIILDWFGKIMRDCAKHGVRLYVLEGTRSHDYRQPTLFKFINELTRINCDLHYIDEVSVVELLNGFTGVFIPDEVNYDASITATEVTHKVANSGWSQVDLAFMHGMFRYQAPIETPISHHEDFYADLVKHLVVVNHIHKPSSRGNIRAPGSPVRLKHGEEEIKGFHVLSITATTTDDWFIEVTDNVVWKTLDVTNQSYKEVSALLDSFDYLENGANLKLRMSRDCPLKPSMREIKRDFPHFSIIEDFTDGKTSQLGIGDELIEHVGIRLTLTPDVIKAKIKEKVLNKIGDDVDTLSLLDELLKEGG